MAPSLTLVSSFACLFLSILYLVLLASAADMHAADAFSTGRQLKFCAVSRLIVCGIVYDPFFDLLSLLGRWSFYSLDLLIRGR